MYIYGHHWNAQESQAETFFFERKAETWGDSDLIHRNERLDCRWLTTCLLGFLLWSIQISTFHSKRIKHFASQTFSIVPRRRVLARKGRKFWGTREGGYKILGKGFLDPPHPPLELGKCPWTYKFSCITNDIDWVTHVHATCCKNFLTQPCVRFCFLKTSHS